MLVAIALVFLVLGALIQAMFAMVTGVSPVNVVLAAAIEAPILALQALRSLLCAPDEVELALSAIQYSLIMFWEFVKSEFTLYSQRLTGFGFVTSELINHQTRLVLHLFVHTRGILFNVFQRIKYSVVASCKLLVWSLLFMAPVTRSFSSSYSLKKSLRLLYVVYLMGFTLLIQVEMAIRMIPRSVRRLTRVKASPTFPVAVATRMK